MSNKVEQLELKAKQLRKDVLEVVYESKAGHIGGSLSSLDILTTLYYAILNINPKEPKNPERDRFILSKGHIAESLYCILADKGYFSKDKLKTYSKFKSTLIGHPNVKNPGIELNTGSLGHGLSASVGIALAGKRDNKNYRVFTLMGDGEQAEGSIWEAAMAASHYKLDNLIAIIDRNGLQISGATEEVMSLKDLAGKWEKFGWHVVEIDGNNIEELLKIFSNVAEVKDKPTMVIAKTIKGKGVSFMENNAKWHHGVPTEEEYIQAVKELEEDC